MTNVLTLLMSYYYLKQKCTDGWWDKWLAFHGQAYRLECLHWGNTFLLHTSTLSVRLPPMNNKKKKAAWMSHPFSSRKFLYLTMQVGWGYILTSAGIFISVCSNIEGRFRALGDNAQKTVALNAMLKVKKKREWSSFSFLSRDVSNSFLNNNIICILNIFLG